MQFDELLVTTGVDALVKLVKDKQKIELTLASQLLNIEESTIEEWSKILEEEGILKIDYSLTKTYLQWVTPKPEQIDHERNSFYDQKSEIQQEIQSMSEELNPKIKEIVDLKKSFDEGYQKLKPRLDALEKKLDSNKSIRGDFGDKFSDKIQKVEDLRIKSKNIEDQINLLNMEMSELKQSLSKSAPAKDKFQEVGKIRSYVDSLKLKMNELDRKIDSISKIPSTSTVQKPDTLRKELLSITSELRLLRENFKTLIEAAGTFDEIDNFVKQREDSVSAIKQELESLYDEIERVKVKSSLLSEKIKGDLDNIDSVDTSVSNTKSSIGPLNKSNMEARISRLEQRLSTIQISGSGDPTLVLDEIKAKRQEMERQKNDLEKEVEDLINAIEEESSTYSTFQKIKERALTSIEEYSSELSKLSKEYGNLVIETDQLSNEIDTDLQKLKANSANVSLDETTKELDSLIQKKNEMEEFSKSLDTSLESTEFLTKKLNLLAKEAKLLEIRSSIGSQPIKEIEGRKTELSNQLTLTKDEQKEFEKKRQELRDLIKKLWEQN